MRERGVTLIELVVVLAILSVLLAIAVPAVQSSRESARQVTCQNNQRQIVLAIHDFHQRQRSLPSPYNGTSLNYPLAEWDLFHMHSWRVPLLPHLEQAALRNRIDWDALATEAVNLPHAQTVVPVYVCPSGGDPSTNLGWGLRHSLISQSTQPPPEADRYYVVRSDYDAIAGIQELPSPFPTGTDSNLTKYIRWGIWGWPHFDNQSTTGGKLLDYRAGKFRDVTGGLSQTIAIVERAGKPIHLIDGRPAPTPTDPDANYPGQVGWSASNSFIWAIHGDLVSVNQNNARGIYSHHPGGAHIAMADGSVRFLSESTEFGMLLKMFSRHADH